MAATTRRFDQNQSTEQKDFSIITQKHKLKLNTNMEGEETRKISLMLNRNTKSIKLIIAIRKSNKLETLIVNLEILRPTAVPILFGVKEDLIIIT